MDNKYYLPTNSVNLAHYFSCACVKPTKYFSARTKDIQSEYPDFLFLSSEKRIKNSDCSLELILTNEEKEKLVSAKNNESFFLLPVPLPLSRVASIFFNSDEQRDKITTLINLSTAFIPKTLAKLFDKETEIDYQELNFDLSKEVPDFSKELKRYNSLLGGFALMKLARESYMNYSENYFSTLSFFNSTIEEELSRSKKVNSIYHDAFLGKDSFKQLSSYLGNEITEDVLERVAKSENQKIKKDVITGLIDYNSLERATYILSVLYSFGVGDEGRKSKIDGLILTNFHKNIKNDRAEVVALCYGLNRGYTVFTNKYSNENGEQIVKFQLDSKVDYFTIESIYQYSFNEVQKSKSFPYLDSIIPKAETRLKKLSKNDYFILDKLVITERIKVGDTKWWNKLLDFFFQKNQAELFKPFLVTVFQKIKEDLEDDFTIQIENKEAELQKLKSENAELGQKLKDAEKKESKAQKSKIETPSDISEIREPEVIYQDNNAELENLRSKVKSFEKLIKAINSQTAMKKTKVLSCDFQGENLFKNQQ